MAGQRPPPLARERRKERRERSPGRVFGSDGGPSVKYVRPRIASCVLFLVREGSLAHRVTEGGGGGARWRSGVEVEVEVEAKGKSG